MRAARFAREKQRVQCSPLAAWGTPEQRAAEPKIFLRKNHFRARGLYRVALRSHLARCLQPSNVQLPTRIAGRRDPRRARKKPACHFWRQRRAEQSPSNVHFVSARLESFGSPDPDTSCPSSSTASAVTSFVCPSSVASHVPVVEFDSLIVASFQAALRTVGGQAPRALTPPLRASQAALASPLVVSDTLIVWFHDPEASRPSSNAASANLLPYAPRASLRRSLSSTA